jgi:hypothetical protein
VWGNGGPSLAGPGGARRKDDEARLIACAGRCYCCGCHQGFNLRGRAGGSGGWGGGPSTHELVVLWPLAAVVRVAWWLTLYWPVLLPEAQNGARGAEWGAATAVLGGGLCMDPMSLCPNMLLGFGGGLWSRVRRSMVVAKVLMCAGNHQARVAWWCCR